MKTEGLLDSWLSKSIFLNSKEKIAECWNAISIIAISFTFLAWAFYDVVAYISYSTMR